MSRTVVVDLGGVVLRWDPPALVAEAWPDLAPDRSSAVDLAERVFQDFVPGSDWAEYDRGAIEPVTLAGRLVARTGLPVPRVRALLDAVPAHLQFVRSTARLLDSLQDKGLRLVYLSNMPLRYADWLDGQDRFRAWFDDGVFSARVGHVKPEPEIFTLAEQRLGLDPAHTLLIDDRVVNLTQAARHGWSTALFVGADRAATDLIRLGWL